MSRNPGNVWLVLPDMLSTRVLIDTGVVARLSAELGDSLVPVPLITTDEAALWGGALERGIPRDDLLAWPGGGVEKASRLADDWLERRLGFFPLAIRLNYRHGFHLERMQPGHRNRFLDSSLVGPLPRTDRVDRAMARWYFSPHRHVPVRLRERMRAECRALVMGNVQISGAGRFLTAARRLRLPVVGYVASWDHPVGKGVMSPHLDRYVVQNEIMRRDLVRFHDIDDRRIVVTGWPQSDVFHRRRTREEADTLLRGLGVDPALPVVLVTGNSPTNAPYEGQFVERLVAWWREAAQGRLSLVFRPHPRDTQWPERYAAAVAAPGVGVQEASYTDMDALAVLLQHVAVVVTNAGTILLDALANDRPVVCVVYDEGAPAGESWAEKNVLGEHYRELMSSGAFPLARDFDEVLDAVEDALADPGRLREARARVTAEVLGTVDGGAAERVADAILEIVGGDA